MSALAPAALTEALGHAVSDKRLEVLRRVGETGSISQAARDAGISYKAAWQAIDTLTNLSEAPLVDRTVWQTGLANPWDLAFLPDSTALITERGGRVRARRPGGALTTVATIGDVLAVGEGGLLGLAVDPLFATNRFIYICFSSGLNGANDNRLVRWRLAAGLVPQHFRLLIGTRRPSTIRTWR